MTFHFPTEEYTAPIYDNESRVYLSAHGEKIGSDIYDPECRSALKTLAMQFIEVDTESDKPRFHTHAFSHEVKACGIDLQHFEAIAIMEESLQLAEMMVHDKYEIRTYVADAYNED